MTSLFSDKTCNSTLPDYEHGKKIPVLYVDDEPELLEIAKLFLEKSGALSVTTSLSAQAVLDDNSYDSYDVIVSDYQMPGLDGIAFLKKIRACSQNIPFILFTGKGREEVIIDALNNGADSYIQKGGDPVAQFAYLEHKIRYTVGRRHSLKALEESEKKYRYLIENAMEGVNVIQDGKIVYCNPKFRELIASAGFCDEDVIGKPFFAMVYPEDQQMMLDRYHRRIGNGEKISRYPFRILTMDGNVRWFEVEAIRIDWNGKPATLNFHREVTEHYYLREELKDSERRYREMVNQLPKTVLEMDTLLHLTFMNKAGREGFGYPTNEIAKKNLFTDLVVPEERTSLQNLCERAMSGKNSLMQEVTAQTREGIRFPMMIYLSPVTKKDEITGFRAVCVDTSDFHKIKNELSQANRKLSLLGSITSHDCRNKLTALRGYLELAGHKTGEAETREFLRKIDTIAEDIADQIEFASTYRHLGTAAPEWQNCTDVACRAKRHFSLESVSMNIELDSLEILADRMFEKVIDNLIDNTLRHGNHATAIRLFCEPQDRDLVIVYEDNGAGIPAGDKSKIFDCGFGKHTGLGLFLMEEILSMTGISITENGIPGKGVRFEIHVPPEGYRFVRKGMMGADASLTPARYGN